MRNRDDLQVKQSYIFGICQTFPLPGFWGTDGLLPRFIPVVWPPDQLVAGNRPSIYWTTQAPCVPLEC